VGIEAAGFGKLAVGEQLAQTCLGRNVVLLAPFARVGVAERTEECDFGNAQSVQEQEQAGTWAAGIAAEDDEGRRSTLFVGTHDDFAGVEELAELAELVEDSRQLREPFERAELKVLNLIFSFYLVFGTNNLLTAHLLMKIFRIL
jgi:hypothetical protein